MSLGPITLQKQSPLMRLPGAIRNKIYDYVRDPNEYDDPRMLPGDLYDPESLYHLHISVSRSENMCRELIHLKYVCRQLYVETGTTGLDQVNELFFPQIAYDLNMPFDRQHFTGMSCVRFLRSCAPCYLANLRAIYINSAHRCFKETAARYKQNEAEWSLCKMSIPEYAAGWSRPVLSPPCNTTSFLIALLLWLSCHTANMAPSDIGEIQSC